MFLHCRGVGLFLDFRLRISASNQPICLRSCLTSASFRFRLGCFLVIRARFCFTLPDTNSAPAYTRQLSLHRDCSPSSYSSTIKSSTALNSCCDTRIPLQEGLPLPLRSPPSQASTVPSTERNSLHSSSELLGSSSDPAVVLSALGPLSSPVSIAGSSASRDGDLWSLPGRQGGDYSSDSSDKEPSNSSPSCIRSVHRRADESTPRASALAGPGSVVGSPSEVEVSPLGSLWARASGRSCLCGERSRLLRELSSQIKPETVASPTEWAVGRVLPPGP